MNTALEELKQKVKDRYIENVGEEAWYKMIAEKVDILKNLKDALGETEEESFRKAVFQSVLEECENEGQELINVAIYEVAFDVFNIFE